MPDIPTMMAILGKVSSRDVTQISSRPLLIIPPHIGVSAGTPRPQHYMLLGSSQKHPAREILREMAFFKCHLTACYHVLDTTRV